MKKDVLFLAHALSGYFVACLRNLASSKEVNIHVVKYPVDAVAPFTFNLESEGIRFYERNEFDRNSLLKLTEEINPDLIICSGWADKDYLFVCSRFNKKIRTVLAFDNPWRNTLKQQIARIAGRVVLKKYFNACWVSGAPQTLYARHLGFHDTEICEGLYAADVDWFHHLYLKYKTTKAAHFPKRILFVGRYAPLKGVKELWESFVKFHSLRQSDWELWCLGKGDLKKKFPDHPRIKDFGFVQPHEMDHYILNTGIFILPAHYEHWGVVVHEFAAAGFPLICSTTTSAAGAFLEEGYNGFYHLPRNIGSLVNVFEKLDSMSDTALSEMGKHSTKLALQYTPAEWSSLVYRFATESRFPGFRFNRKHYIDAEQKFSGT